MTPCESLIDVPELIILYNIVKQETSLVHLNAVVQSSLFHLILHKEISNYLQFHLVEP